MPKSFTPRKLQDPKVCTTCKVAKPRVEFSPHAVAPRGVQSSCKECWAKRTRERNAANPSFLAMVNRRSKLKRTYGLTLGDYDALLASQSGACAICKTKRPGGMGMFPVDHCHKTGRIRGLLCNQCNVGLGSFKDEPELLKNAINYLKG